MILAVHEGNAGSYAVQVSHSRFPGRLHRSPIYDVSVRSQSVAFLSVMSMFVGVLKTFTFDVCFCASGLEY